MSDDKKIDMADAINSSEQRGLRWRLKQANKTMGRQGQTIAALRGELARAREETSKIDRGELRRLERFTADDVQLRERRLAFHRGDEAPKVRRYVGEALDG